jgi:archaeal flagellin FlaB
MTRIKQFISRMRGERGVTGLETAIILIAFVVVASVFAFVVLSVGLFSSERSKETVYAGLAKTRGTMELTGSVTAATDAAVGPPAVPGANLTTITFDVTLAAGGDAVNWDDSGTGTNRTVIKYVDGTMVLGDVAFTTTEITGNGDKLLEPGELFQITITALSAQPGGPIVIGTNQKFTLEVQPPSGSYMVIQRTTPASISPAVVDLN